MKKCIVSVLIVGTALLVSACSSDSDSRGHAATTMDESTTTTLKGSSTTMPMPADAPFNAADVQFAQGMIPHHAQAVEMADMALQESADAQIKDLAGRIRAAQDPEIQTMSEWLTEWGQEVPDTSAPIGADMGDMPMGDMPMDDMPMDGMMTASDMNELSAATGVEFDQMFLSMMVLHHQSAVTMAQQELTAGKSGAAKELAQSIITAQTAEIAEMQQLETSA